MSKNVQHLKRYTAKEREFIDKNFHNLEPEEIAKKLGRTPIAIKSTYYYQTYKAKQSNKGSGNNKMAAEVSRMGDTPVRTRTKEQLIIDLRNLSVKGILNLVNMLTQEKVNFELTA